MGAVVAGGIGWEKIIRKGGPEGVGPQPKSVWNKPASRARVGQ